MNTTEDLKNLADLIEQDTRKNGGASYTINGETPPARGYMVSLPLTEWRLEVQEMNTYTITHYIGKHLATLCSGQDSMRYIGTWIDEDTGEVCFDVSWWIEDEESARDLGEFGEQKAIFDLANGKTITL